MMKTTTRSDQAFPGKSTPVHPDRPVTDHCAKSTPVHPDRPVTDRCGKEQADEGSRQGNCVREANRLKYTGTNTKDHDADITADFTTEKGDSGRLCDDVMVTSPNTVANDSTGNALSSPLPLPLVREKDDVQVYRRRWLMLFLFCCYSFSNAVQWIHLSIIGNVLEKYYNQSLPTDQYARANAIDWLSMVFMLAYVPLIFPATWLLDKRGLRLCNVAGCFLNAVAAWLKCASVGEDLFWLLMLAQTVGAISQLWVLGIPARLAAVWFGPHEVSTATSLGVFGNQIGIAVGFLTPPAIVDVHSSLEDISTHLRNMFYGTAAITTAIFIANLALFQREPPTPPSRAQQQQLELEVNADYGKSLLKLIRNRGFVLLMVSYGMNTGSFYAVSTLLNNIVLDYFPGEEENAGRIGLTLVLTGIIGAVAAGVWLDKTRTFKGTSLGIYLLTTASMAAFAWTLSLDRLWVVFLTAGMLGLTMTGYLPVGFEFAAELTFPESEGTSSGLLNASAQVFGIILTMGMRAMMVSVSVLWANISLVIVLSVGTLLTGLIKADYRRQAAGKEIVAGMVDVEVEAGTETAEKCQTHGSANSAADCAQATSGSQLQSSHL